MIFNFGDSLDIDVKIVNKKSIPIHIPIRKKLDDNDPLLKECSWMLKKYEELKDEERFDLRGLMENFYELQDEYNNNFHFQTKKELGQIGQTIRLNKCRVKAKKTFNDGKVVYILGSGSQKQYESYRKNTR